MSELSGQPHLSDTGGGTGAGRQQLWEPRQQAQLQAHPQASGCFRTVGGRLVVLTQTRSSRTSHYRPLCSTFLPCVNTVIMSALLLSRLTEPVYPHR